MFFSFKRILLRYPLSCLSHWQCYCKSQVNCSFTKSIRESPTWDSIDTREIERGRVDRRSPFLWMKESPSPRKSISLNRFSCVRSGMPFPFYVGEIRRREKDLLQDTMVTLHEDDDDSARLHGEMDEDSSHTIQPPHRHSHIVDDAETGQWLNQRIRKERFLSSFLDPLESKCSNCLHLSVSVCSFR